MKPVTIAIVAACPYPTWQGSQVLIRQMAEALSRRGHNVHVVTYGYGEYELTHEYRVHRVPELPFSNGFRSGPSAGKLLLDLLLAIKLFSVVRHEGIEIIHAHNYEAVFSSFPASRILGVPLVYHSHTILSRELFTYFDSVLLRDFSKRLAPLIDALTLRLADHLIAVSEEEMEFFAASGKNPGVCTLLPPGIVIEGTAAGTASEEENTLCYMGNLDIYQDLDTLFRALKIASGKVKGIRLYIVTRSDWSACVKRIGEMGLSGRVSFERPATFEDALSVLRKSNIAVITRNVPSGFPIKLLNYMACGKAIIASRSAAKALRYEECACIVEDGDAEGLAGAITNLLEDEVLRAGLGLRAQNLAAQQYDWDSRAEQLESVYSRLLGRTTAV